MERRSLESLMRRQKETNDKLSLFYLLFYLRTGDFTFRIYVDYSGNVISLEMKGDQFYFRNILSALSLEGYIVIRREEGGGEGRNHGTFVLLFLFQQRSFLFPLRRLQYGLCSCHFPFPRSAKNVSSWIR